MKPLYLFLLLLLIVEFSSCCTFDKCAESQVTANVRLLSAATGKDLVFGSNAVFDKSQIKFYTLHGADTTVFYWTPQVSNNGLDTSLGVTFYSIQSDTLYVRLRPSDIDTMGLRINVVDSRCCGSFTSVVPGSYNGQLISRDSSGLFIIKK